MSTKRRGPGGVGKLAKILTHVDRGTEKHVMETLGKHNRQVAERLHERMFTFDDLTELDDKTIEAAVRHLDMGVLALALRGVPAEILEKILRNMSQRAAEMLRSDIEVLGPQPRSKVGEAQQEIMHHLRDLEGAGRISLVRSDDKFIE